MVENKKREIAYKLKIGDILKGTPIVEDIAQDIPNSQETLGRQATKERFRFLELGDKRIIRVNIVANIVDRYSQEGEKNFLTLTVDDASGQIRVKAFGETIKQYEDLVQGETILIIGVLRSYNQEVYISPEIIRKIDPRYLLVRKLELEKNIKSMPNIIDTTKKIGLREEILEIIKSGDANGGASTEEIILKIKNSDPSIINSEIIRLIEDGTIYEPRPGRLRYLG